VIDSVGSGTHAEANESGRSQRERQYGLDVDLLLAIGRIGQIRLPALLVEATHLEGGVLVILLRSFGVDKCYNM
jgi:hypothetical protein